MELRTTALTTVLIAASVAHADPPATTSATKEACLDAHSKGQDARESGRLTVARQSFLMCARQSCPALVQGDCARWADDIAGMLPTVGFTARDDRGVDLADTEVYVDDVLVAGRLDDGRLFDIDPGRHVVRFVHHGREQRLVIIIGGGEKGRTIATVFAPRSERQPAPARAAATTAHANDRPGGAKVALIAGGVGVAAGAALTLFGLHSIPDGCSLASHRCAAPPQDPVFAQAGRGAELVNGGLVLGAVGVASVVVGAIWYRRGGHREHREQPAVGAWWQPHGGGVAMAGRF